MWGRLPGSAAVGKQAVEAEGELVGHRDYCPGGVLFRDGLPAALIGFGLARPTPRPDKNTNALYWRVPPLDPRDRAPAFADAYGAAERQRADLVPPATRMIHGFHEGARAAAERESVFHRRWGEGIKDRLPRAETRTTRHGPAIAGRITT